MKYPTLELLCNSLCYRLAKNFGHPALKHAMRASVWLCSGYP